MFETNKRRCTCCLIQEERAGKRIRLNEAGLCNLCAKETKNKEIIDWELRREMFETILNGIHGKGDFDGLIMLSGGKDSVYTAYLLSKVYHMKLLALTIDNHYEYPETFVNSKSIAKKLNIPLLNYHMEPEQMKKYYRFLLTEDAIKRTDASQLCFFCGRFLKYLAADIAVRFNIPAVFSGHNLEQIQSLGDETGIGHIDQTRQRYFRAQSQSNYKKASEALQKNGQTAILPLFEKNLQTIDFTNFIYPLQYFEYKPSQIIETIKRELDWKPIQRFSEKYISSGCRIAKVLQYVAKQNDTITYVDQEFSDQIRQGSLEKEELKAFYASRVEDQGEVEEILGELGIAQQEELFF